jgi:hypothetical protein
MTPVDYELGRQIREERRREASAHRLACQFASARRSRMAVSGSLVTRELGTWIGSVAGLIRAELRHHAAARTWIAL